MDPTQTRNTYHYPIVTQADHDYDCNEFLRNLPGYDQSYGTERLLDLARIINESGNYQWEGVTMPSIPSGAQTNVIASGTLNGTVALPPGTYVISLTHYITFPNIPPVSNFGFKLKLWDKGTKTSIFYGDYSLADLVSSPMQVDPAVGLLPSDTPFGPAFLTSPLIITPPGNLNWEIVNLAGVDVLVQIMAQCAVPINNRYLGTRDVQVG